VGRSCALRRSIDQSLRRASRKRIEGAVARLCAKRDAEFSRDTFKYERRLTIRRRDSVSLLDADRGKARNADLKRRADAGCGRGRVHLRDGDRTVIPAGAPRLWIASTGRSQRSGQRLSLTRLNCWTAPGEDRSRGHRARSGTDQRQRLREKHRKEFLIRAASGIGSVLAEVAGNNSSAAFFRKRHAAGEAGREYRHSGRYGDDEPERQ